MASDETEYATLEQAEAAYGFLRDKLLSIEMQLSDRDRRHPDGRRMGDREYHEWRHEAIRAKTHTLRRMGALRPRLAALRAERAGTFATPPGVRLRRRNDRLTDAILAAIESAEEEGVHVYRGTDRPREFVTILRNAVNGDD